MKDDDLEIALGPGAEFDLVRRFAAAWGERATTLGDDAAVLPLSPGVQLLVSTDTSVEGVHFARGWLTPYEIGWRATAAGLSDLAAMGARPLGTLTALTLPESWLADAVEIATGIGDAVHAVGTRVIGGDLTRGSELSLGVTVLGSTSRALSRAGALPGDTIFVTGRLGGVRAALDDLANRRAPAPDHRQRFARPHPRIREAMWLAAHGAHAAVDVSDGLVADVAHVAAASGVLIELDLDRLPLSRGVAPELAAASGEEYEVVVAAGRELDTRAFHHEFGLDLTAVGRVLGAEADGAVIVKKNGTRVDPPSGHDHFSR